MSNRRKPLSYDDKFAIIYKFLEENNFNTIIKARTKFGEYPIGQWQSRMRVAYYRGELDLDPDLEAKFLELGILRKEKERETAEKLTWEEKYVIMEEYLRNGQPIEHGTIYKGYRIGQWQTVIRHLLYKDSLTTVSPELKKKFFKSGILKKEKGRIIGRGSKKFSYDKKFEIMLQYLESTDFVEEIHQKTTFEEYSIGVWQDNLRQTYRKGRDLEISPELMEKMFTYGILREEDKNVRQSKISQKEPKASVTNLSINDKDEIEQVVEQLLRKQEERKVLDAEIAELQDIIKAKTDNGFEI